MRPSGRHMASVTTVLTLGSVLSRIWGFVMRAILARLIGPEGMGLNQVVWTYFMGFVIPIAAGLSPAVSRLVARYSDGRRTPCSDRIVAAGVFIGVVASTIAIILARMIRPGLPGAREALSPGAAGLMIASTSIYTVVEAFFIGSRNVGLLVVAEQIQEIVRLALIVAILVQSSALSIGLRLRWIIVLTAFSETLGLAWLSSRYAATEVSYSTTLCSRQRLSTPTPRIASEILVTAFPISLTRLIGSLLRMAEVSAAPQALVRSGLGAAAALAAYGQVTGMAAPVIMIPGILTSSLAVAIVPEIARCKSTREARAKAWAVSGLSLVFGLGAAWAISTFSEGICRILYGGACDPSILARTAALAPALFVDQVSSAALRGMGRANAALASDVASWVLRLALISTLPSQPSFGATGVIVALIASSSLSAILNLVAVAFLSAAPPGDAATAKG